MEQQQQQQQQQKRRSDLVGVTPEERNIHSQQVQPGRHSHAMP